MKNKILLLVLMAFSFSVTAMPVGPPENKTMKIAVTDVGEVTIPMEQLSLKQPTVTKTEPTVISKVNADVLYDDFKSLAKHYGVKADTLVAKAFTVLSSTTQEVWDILVLQQRVNALYHLSLLLLELWLIYQWYIFLNRYLAVPKDDRNDNNIFLLVISALALIAFGIYNSIYMINVYTGLINPKYAAMKEILELSKILK